VRDAPAPTRRAVFTVANPQAQPSREWVRAVARLLLAHVDREIQRERDAAGSRADPGQGDGRGDGQKQEGGER